MSKSETGRGADQFVVRLPDGMRDRIAEAAKENKRSMNAEIVARLEVSFEVPALTSELSTFMDTILREYRVENDRLVRRNALVRRSRRKEKSD